MIESGQKSLISVCFVSTAHTMAPIARLAVAAPIAAIRMPFLPPRRSTSGPFTKNENAYTPVPIPKIIPKS